MLELSIVIIAFLFIVSFVIFDRDLLAPPTAVALVFLAAMFCTYYNEETWGLQYSLQTTQLIASAIIATMLGGMIGVVLANFPTINRFAFSHVVEKPQVIRVNVIKTLVVIAFQLVAMILAFQHIRRLTGTSNPLLAVTQYRALTGRNLDVNDETMRMSSLTRNMIQASKMMGVVYAYIVGNNLVASKKKLSLNLVPILLHTINTFMQGDRSNMIRLFVIIMVVAYTVHRRSVGWRKSKETAKLIRRMVIAVVLIGVLFSSVRGLVGRTSEKDMLSYVTFYAGSPIAVLDQFWRKPLPKPQIWGRKTFYYLNQSLTALFGWPGRYNYYSDFVTSPTGTSVGNAPTALRDPFVEFGFGGFFLIMMLFGIIYTWLYCRSRKRKNNSPIDFRLLFYAYISYTFFMYFYASFNDWVTHIIFKYIIELLLIRWALVGWHFKSRIRFSTGATRTIRLTNQS